MMRKLVVLAIVGAVIGFGLFWFLTMPSRVEAGSLRAHNPNLDSGRTMFFAGGCASCHAIPKQDDPTRLGGGLGLRSPFGTFYVPNISSDQKDGIGAWNEAQFVTAMTKGVSPSGAHYFPAFPYTSYHLMRTEDVRDLFAFLKTIPAISGRVRDHDVPFPFNVRRTLGLWKLLFLDDRTFTPDPAQSAEWNHGAYLVNGPGHCAECHSPRTFIGNIIGGQRFAGGPNPEGEGFIPNITQQRLKDWSAQDIAYVLESGQTPEGDFVGGLMAAVVRNTSKLTEADRAAMATYIKSLAPVQGSTPPPKKAPAS